MDNNQVTPIPPQAYTQNSPAIPPVTPGAGANPLNPGIGLGQVPPTIVQKSEGGGGKKLAMFLLIAVLLISAVGGGVYYFLGTQQSQKSDDGSSALVPQQIAAQPVATPTQMDPIDTDLSALKIDSIDSAMSQVDQSLKSL